MSRKFEERAFGVGLSNNEDVDVRYLSHREATEGGAVIYSTSLSTDISWH